MRSVAIYVTIVILLHAVPGHGLPVDPLRYLDGGDGGQPRGGVRHEQLQPEVSEAGGEVVSAEAVAPPAVLQPLLRHQGQTLPGEIKIETRTRRLLSVICVIFKPEGIHGVDWPSVMVDTALVRPAVPVFSQPRQI